VQSICYAVNSTLLTQLRFTADDNTVRAAILAGGAGSALHNAIVAGAINGVVRTTGADVDDVR